MSETLDLSGLGSLNFAPSWATKTEKVNVGKVRPEREDRAPGGERRPAGDRKSFGDRRSFGDRKGFGQKRPFGDRRGPKPFVEREPRLELDVKILPETKALGTIIRKLQGDFHAYKLKDLAYFFLDNPSSILLKVTPKRDEKAVNQAPAVVFHQCKVCGFASMKESDVVDHALAVHLADYFDAKEVEVEAPKGNFNCVAKCGLSGVLLGPPNIHEFNSVVKEMIRTRYPDMSEAEYRSRIEMVRDAETIEEWRKSATKKTMYFVKGTAEQEGAVQMTRSEAEGEFRRNILPSLLEVPKHLMITAEQAVKSPVKSLVWAAKDAIEAERRAPYNMCFALRGAFHHRKLNFFRANDSRGPEFVLNAELKAFDGEHAIPELATAAKFLEEHPCLDRSEFPAEIADFEKHLTWLVTTGHAVAFTNGVFSAAEKFPKYGPQWKKRGVKTEEKPETTAGGEPQESTASGLQQETTTSGLQQETTAGAPVEETTATEVKEEVKAEEKKDETAAQLAE